jgi:flagellar biosynthesis GTPase FlhF
MSKPEFTTKQCLRCRNEYLCTPIYWYRNKSRSDGLSLYCKDCDKNAQKKSRVNHPEKRKAVIKRYLENNPENRKKSVKKYLENSREKQRRDSKKYRELNAERLREKQREAARLVRKNHPEKKREQEWRRRVRKANAEGNHNINDVNELYIKQKGRCFHCEKELNGVYHEDHWIPLSRGGSDWIDNIRLLCPFCNLSKKDKLPHEWSDKYH